MPRPKSRTHTKRRKPRTRGLSRFKRSETARLLKGALDAGLPVRGLEADPVTGKYTVLVGAPTSATAEDESAAGTPVGRSS
jgi:hypothetical protein